MLDRQARRELEALPPLVPEHEGQTIDQAINLRVDAFLMDAGAGVERADVERFVRAQVKSQIVATDDGRRTTHPPPFRFFKHFDYGLLREVPDSLQYHKWMPDTGTWQAILLNPFTASMSQISEVQAGELAAGGNLFAPITAEERPGGKVVPVRYT
jgi:hypothetical protein